MLGGYIAGTLLLETNIDPRITKPTPPVVLHGHSEPAPTKRAHHPLDVCYHSVVDEPQLS